FIDITASETQQGELLSELENLAGVDSVDFVPKEEGLDSLIASLGDQGEIFESLRDENPLNDVFVVQAEDPEETDII
ncbi:permease-like cell division protein FtsX, partial [Pseudomonas sp. 2822-15]|uniref:permease-like cell division protein FtsX n=1 Tax=Pseudomonas sp. 2822-15 TaxID=1712677 RepID=UPI001C473A08